MPPAAGPGQSESNRERSGDRAGPEGPEQKLWGGGAELKMEGIQLSSLDRGPQLLLHLAGETPLPRWAHLVHSQGPASQVHLRGHQGQPLSQAKCLAWLGVAPWAPRLITAITCCPMVIARIKELSVKPL